MSGAAAGQILVSRTLSRTPMLRSLRISTGAAFLQPGLPSYRRMPPPSRLPEMDIDDAAVLPPPSSCSRSKGLLRGLLATLVDTVRR
jgi:hypothetical protein